MEQYFGKDGGRGYSMPEQGIYNADGDLFHHAEPAKYFLPVNDERLREHGICAKSSKAFTTDEDALVRRNWEDYRGEFGYAEGDILQLSGMYQGKANNSITSKCRHQTLRTTRFWPRICAGLPHRTAHAVRCRIAVIFDRFGGSAEFDDGDDIFLMQMIRSGKGALECADSLKKSINGTRARITRLRKRTLFSHSERRRLWNVAKSTHLDVFLDDAVPRTNELDWAKLSTVLFREKSTLATEWNKMTAELLSLQNDGCTLTEALGQVAPLCPRITPAQLCDYVELLLDEISPSSEMSISKVARQRVSRRMAEFGVTGFKTLRWGEFYYCWQHTCRILYRIRRHLLKPAGLKLSNHSQLALLSRCLRSLKDPIHSQRIELRTVFILRQLISMQEERDPEWKPRRKLRNFLTKHG